MPQHRQTNTYGRNRHTGPPWHNPPLSNRSGPDPSGGNCHTNYAGQLTGEDSCVLPFALTPNGLSGHGRLFGGGLPVFLAGDLNAILELATEHEEETLT
jgi:hypothetical protein